MTFEEKVKKARINAGMSQAQLAEKVGVSVRAITAYERDGSKPRPAKLAKLAEALKVSTNYLTDDNCDNPLKGLLKTHISMRQGQDTVPAAHGTWKNCFHRIRRCLPVVI